MQNNRLSTEFFYMSDECRMNVGLGLKHIATDSL